jgi:hypothetical protein
MRREQMTSTLNLLNQKITQQQQIAWVHSRY